jgi:hypothetical protein
MLLKNSRSGRPQSFSGFGFFNEMDPLCNRDFSGPYGYLVVGTSQLYGFAAPLLIAITGAMIAARQRGKGRTNLNTGGAHLHITLARNRRRRDSAGR